MTLTSRNVLSIIECIFYAPATVLSLFLCIRHCCGGQRSQIAWVFLYIYCHIRVAEAALDLATITFPSVALYGTSILFSLIGVPALLLATFGLLNRVYINLAKNHPTRIKPWYFSLLQIPFQAAPATLPQMTPTVPFTVPRFGQRSALCFVLLGSW
jgi:hypothetical protein